MTPETITKIRSHKYANRKLATGTACARYNAMLREDTATDLKAAISGSTDIQAQITRMNSALNAFRAALGLTAVAGANAIIEIAEYTDGQIPLHLWLGRIQVPNGDLSDANKQAAQTARGDFADAAGIIRAKIAKYASVIGLLNDLGNSSGTPNVGGTVGDPAHSHTAAQSR